MEEKTRLQYKSEAWLKERKLRFTASKFGRVSRRQKNFEKFCKDMMNAKPVTTQSMEHGILYEPVALREYQHYRKKLGCPVKVTVFVSPKIFVLGCSPDGKVVDPSCEDMFGLVEVKCPSSKFNVTPTDATSDSRFCLHMENGVAKLKKDHEYYDQVQGQIAITGTKWCDFVVYTSLGLNIDRVYFDAEHWKKLRQKLLSVYFRYFLPVATEEKQ